ncbi:MAG: lipoyl(octanoyl) transferase LipB [Candidatus Neomarinimicrobiota bacterium]|jgi:lipoyl(octanoyl) transferase|tara:strand:- start:3107 stop:3712 length:606 start_codon:yes stop_codon:yes gene_type:complete
MLFKIQDLQQLNYNDTLKIQQDLREQIALNKLDDSLIIVEHDHVYTLGKNANPNNILNDNCNIVQTDRGGDVTYHGPGQLVIYPIFNLKKKNIGVKTYIKKIEEIIQLTLADFKIDSHVPFKETGVWANNKKIASIGIHVSRGITMHGFAINVATDLSYFDHIVSCGIEGVKMTSVEKELEKKIPMNDIKTKVVKYFNQLF